MKMIYDARSRFPTMMLIVTVFVLLGGCSDDVTDPETGDETRVWGDLEIRNPFGDYVDVAIHNASTGGSAATLTLKLTGPSVPGLENLKRDVG